MINNNEIIMIFFKKIIFINTLYKDNKKTHTISYAKSNKDKNLSF